MGREEANEFFRSMFITFWQHCFAIMTLPSVITWSIKEFATLRAPKSEGCAVVWPVTNVSECKKQLLYLIFSNFHSLGDKSDEENSN